MKNSMGIEKKVLTRDARPAAFAAFAAAGLAWPPAATASADAMLTFWLRQITPHTLRNIVVASNAPIPIDMPCDAFEVPQFARPTAATRRSGT